jgi:hypothetical protein
MNRILIGFMISVATTSAVAQPRPSTVAMGCGHASGLVASAGAIVLGTGGHTYDRFVRDGSFCVRGEVTEPVWVLARDTPQCFVGYRCRTPYGRRS